jgi:hypothetical protein
MNVRQIIKVHTNLWAKNSRSFQTIRVGSLRFSTQNLSKPSKNTDWVKGDPGNRKLTWIFEGGSYVGYVREYLSQGQTVTEVHKTNPDRLIFKEAA